MNPVAVIKTEGLTKHYRTGITRKKVEALSDLSLTVGEGEVFAFLGLNGAGKTTTIKLLLDHARPTTGRAMLFGMDAIHPAVRTRVGYLPDLPYFYRFLSAHELLDYTGKLFGLKRSERALRAGRLLKLVGLEGREHEAIKGFSRGMLQRVGLAQALINDPALVILDEPLGGLDPVGRVELREIIAGLKREGRTVFFSSHLLDDAQRLADRVGIIHHGRLIACGTLDELLTQGPEWEAEVVPGNETDIGSLCRQRGWKYEPSGGTEIMVLSQETELHELYGLAASGKITIRALNRRRISLEEAFLMELGRWQV